MLTLLIATSNNKYTIVNLFKILALTIFTRYITKSSGFVLSSLRRPKPPPFVLLHRNRICFKMSGQIIDGKAISIKILNEIKEEVEILKENNNKIPGLAVILVGSRKDSQTYVRMKKKACNDCGLFSLGFDYPDTVSQNEILENIYDLNRNPEIHGILVQLPLPSHLDESFILNAICKEKDVDGLHPLNTASLCSTSTHFGAEKVDWTNFRSLPFHIACTPQGCIELLDRYEVKIESKRAVVIGRSNLVGLPVAMLLMHRNATVTIVHSKTPNPESVVKEADIVIAAVGKAGIVKADWLKPGCVVIDVGINSVDDPSKKRGYRLVGDVDFENAKEVASLITPVPGGVGPLTIAMLMRNTVDSCRHSLQN